MHPLWQVVAPGSHWPNRPFLSPPTDAWRHVLKQPPDKCVVCLTQGWEGKKCLLWCDKFVGRVYNWGCVLWGLYMLHYPRTELQILSWSAEYWQLQLWSSNGSGSENFKETTDVYHSLRCLIEILVSCLKHIVVFQAYWTRSLVNMLLATQCCVTLGDTLNDKSFNYVAVKAEIQRRNNF